MKKIAITIGVVFIFFAITLLSTPLWGKFVVTKMLHYVGFPNAQIEAFAPSQNGFRLENITLDQNQKSIVKSAYFTLLPTPHITIDNAVITANLDKSFHLHIDGFDTVLTSQSKIKPHRPLFDRININNMILKLVTPYDAIDLKINAIINRDKNNLNYETNIEAAQSSLSFNAVATGNINAAQNRYIYNIRADDIKASMAGYEFSRSTLAIKNENNVVTGQALIGLLKHQNKILRQANISLNTTQKPFFVINAEGENGQKIDGIFNTLADFKFVISATDISQLLTLVPIEIKDQEKIMGNVRLDLRANTNSIDQLNWILTTTDSRIIAGSISRDKVFN